MPYGEQDSALPGSCRFLASESEPQVPDPEHRTLSPKQQPPKRTCKVAPGRAPHVKAPSGPGGTRARTGWACAFGDPTRALVGWSAGVLPPMPKSLLEFCPWRGAREHTDSLTILLTWVARGGQIRTLTARAHREPAERGRGNPDCAGRRGPSCSLEAELQNGDCPRHLREGPGRGARADDTNLPGQQRAQG